MHDALDSRARKIAVTPLYMVIQLSFKGFQKLWRGGRGGGGGQLTSIGQEIVGKITRFGRV